jgi:Zn finger protein HypA/HybF involved in hydrogenase expression
MKEIKCEHCGYEWNTASRLIYVTCPSCYKKAKVKKGEKYVIGDTSKSEI